MTAPAKPRAAKKPKPKPKKPAPSKSKVKAPKKAAKAPVKNAGGRPGYERDEKIAQIIESMVGLGIRFDQIALMIDISKPTLRKYYGRELQTGKIKATVTMAQSLFDKAKGNGPQAVAANIFWLKTQAGWSETPRIDDETNPDGSPIGEKPESDDDEGPLQSLTYYTDAELETLEQITKAANARRDQDRARASKLLGIPAPDQS